jgi:hypothetical protein
MSKYYSESAKQVRTFLKLPYVLRFPRIAKIVESEWIWIFNTHVQVQCLLEISRLDV